VGNVTEKKEMLLWSNYFRGNRSSYLKPAPLPILSLPFSSMRKLKMSPFVALKKKKIIPHKQTERKD
jgi:hypothetical protein